jgi:hypothetical protein
MIKRFMWALIAAVIVLGQASPVEARTCANGRSADAAMWLSIAWPGLGEWHLNGWGSFRRNVPKKKFWMAWIPVYGWVYLRIVSAEDTAHCRTDDDLTLGG